jgi:hypothetical protein
MYLITYQQRHYPTAELVTANALANSVGEFLFKEMRARPEAHTVVLWAMEASDIDVEFLRHVL